MTGCLPVFPFMLAECHLDVLFLYLSILFLSLKKLYLENYVDTCSKTSYCDHACWLKLKLIHVIYALAHCLF